MPLVELLREYREAAEDAKKERERQKKEMGKYRKKGRGRRR